MRQKKMLLLVQGIFAIVMLALAMPMATASTYKIIHDFTWAKAPSGNLIFDAAGNLYGTADGGSTKCSNGCGVVWELKPNLDGTWLVQILHAFTGADGADPYLAGLIFDAAGNLYGTTLLGGAGGLGVVFQLKPNPDGTWTEAVLHSFVGGADGAAPRDGVVFDAAGNLYGTTTAGGGGSACTGFFAGCGTVFKLAPNLDGTWTESVLHVFMALTGPILRPG